MADFCHIQTGPMGGCNQNPATSESGADERSERSPCILKLAVQLMEGSREGNEGSEGTADVWWPPAPPAPRGLWEPFEDFFLGGFAFFALFARPPPAAAPGSIPTPTLSGCTLACLFRPLLGWRPPCHFASPECSAPPRGVFSWRRLLQLSTGRRQRDIGGRRWRSHREARRVSPK